MKFPDWLEVCGDTSYRDKKCPKETVEQVTFFAELRKRWPTTIALIAIHVRNEGMRTWSKAAMERAEGMVPGACDIIIPGSPALCIEIKRQDHTASHWQKGQIEYLQASKAAGANVCVCLGWKAAFERVEAWAGQVGL